MTTTVNLRRILDRKQWEMCNFAPGNSTVGSFTVSSNLDDQYQYFVNSATSCYMYDPAEDGWTTLPSPALAGTFGAGSCGVRHPWGPFGTATAGSTTTITTNLNIQRSLTGYTIRITAGPNAGQERTILSNTTGTNSVITVDTPYTVAITTASTYTLLTGRIWVLNAGTLASGSFKYYDVALNTWITASQTGLPATIGTDGRLVATPGYLEDFAVGTATSATSTTLVNSAKAWVVNSFAGYQVRITAGTGAGQYRVITSNTATTLTVPAWTITPDATSQYTIEGNSDAIYFLGNNAVTMYKYSVSGNTWTTVTPAVARSGNPVAGMNAMWVWNVNHALWSDENSGCLNGQFIYSFRGNGAILDRYNISTNSWENDIAYSTKSETFASGTSWAYVGNYIYGIIPGGRMLKYNIVQQRLEPCSQLWYAQGTTVIGDRLFDVSYVDGATKLTWLYYITHTQNTMFRTLIF